SGERMTSADLFRLADAAYGGTQAEGAYGPKDAYDALELAVNRYIHDEYGGIGSSVNAAQAARIARQIGQGVEILPTQTRRDEEQIQFQQFSTPPDYAAAVAWRGNLDTPDTVLEPSAGLGGIAVHALDAAGTVMVNELSTRRAALIRQLPFDR